MPVSVLYLEDALNVDYDCFIRQAVTTLGIGANRIDVILGNLINDCADLACILTDTYSSVRKHATSIGHDYLLEINVLFELPLSRLRELSKEWLVAIKPVSEKFPLPASCLVLDGAEGVRKPDLKIARVLGLRKNHMPVYTEGVFHTVAVGGTFDHLHDGHKILLSISAWLAGKKLIIGITGPSLLTKKLFATLVELLDNRRQAVARFVALARPSAFLDIYEINDVCGPAGFLKDMDALVVSHESHKGGQFVNDYRKKQGFRPLAIISIDVIGSDEASEDNNWVGKLSSTLIRQLELKKSGVFLESDTPDDKQRRVN